MIILATPLIMLPHIGDQPTHLHVSIVGQHGLIALGSKINRRLSLHKARRATPINQHAVMRGGRFIAQLHGPIVGALDRGDTELQGRLIRIGFTSWSVSHPGMTFAMAWGSIRKAQTFSTGASSV